MMQNNLDWDDLGRNIQDIVDRAVNSRDYDRLNQTIRQVVGRAVDLGSEAVRRAVDATGQPPNATRPAAAEKKDLPVLYANVGGKTAGGVLLTVFGACLAIAAIPCLILGMALPILEALFASLGFIFLIAGASMVLAGAGILARLKRFKTYRKTLGQKTHCALEKLARSVGKSVKFVRRELRKMTEQGLFLEGHMDREGVTFITSHETYRNFEQSRLALEARKRQEAAAEQQKQAATHTPQVQEVLNRGNAFVAEIRRCNDDIPGEEISGKIDRMEIIVRRIFLRAEEHPEIVPDLKKLMDYYLPMTVKLLNAYADMDAQPIQGETIRASKREIEATLDTLNQAFEKLLDDLFADTAMDVSSDISVLNTLLAQEGLKEDELTKMKKQNI